MRPCPVLPDCVDAPSFLGASRRRGSVLLRPPRLRCPRLSRPDAAAARVVFITSLRLLLRRIPTPPSRIRPCPVLPNCVSASSFPGALRRCGSVPLRPPRLRRPSSYACCGRLACAAPSVRPSALVASAAGQVGGRRGGAQVAGAGETSGLELDQACSLNCPCDQPKKWRSQHVSLPVLLQVKINNFTGAGHEFYFLTRLCRCAPMLRIMIVLFSNQVVPSDKQCE